MSMIEAKGLSKSFMQAVKEPGLKGAVKHLFLPRHIEKVAVKPLDLRIEAGRRWPTWDRMAPVNRLPSRC